MVPNGNTSLCRPSHTRSRLIAHLQVGAPAALLFGYLSDSVNRRNLLFLAVLLGERGRQGGAGGVGRYWGGVGAPGHCRAR